MARIFWIPRDLACLTPHQFLGVPRGDRSPPRCIPTPIWCLTRGWRRGVNRQSSRRGRSARRRCARERPWEGRSPAGRWRISAVRGNHDRLKAWPSRSSHRRHSRWRGRHCGGRLGGWQRARKGKGGVTYRDLDRFEVAQGHTWKDPPGDRVNETGSGGLPRLQQGNAGQHAVGDAINEGRRGCESRGGWGRWGGSGGSVRARAIASKLSKVLAPSILHGVQTKRYCVTQSFKTLFF